MSINSLGGTCLPARLDLDCSAWLRDARFVVNGVGLSQNDVTLGCDCPADARGEDPMSP